MKLRSEVLEIIADLIAAVGRQRMMDRPQIGDVVLVFSWAANYIEAEVTAIAERPMDSLDADYSRYQVRPVQGWLRRRRWIYRWDIHGIVCRAVDRQRQQEIEKLERML